MGKKVGFDAKWFFEGPPSGKVVVRNLIQQITNEVKDYELIIFLDKKYKKEPFPFNNYNVRLEYVWAKNNLLSNFFILPFKAKKLGIDILVYQNFVDFFRFFKKIAYIHDILFLTHPKFYTFKEKLYFAPLKFLTSKSDLVITVSHTEKNRLIKNKYIEPDNIKVAYHGVNPIFRPLKKQNTTIINQVINKYNLPKRFVLFVGRLNVRKNIKNLIAAFQDIDNDVILVIAGEANWKTENYRELVKKLKLQDKVMFIGSVFDDELSALYSLAEIFCFPSYAESFGLPVLEAMASGVPVIASNVTSLPEVCGDAALYVDPSSVNSIAKELKLLLNNSNLRQKLIEKGLNRAETFTWANSSKSILLSIEQLLDQKSSL